MSVPWSSRFNTLTRIFAGEHDGAEFGKLLAREVKTIPIDSDLAASTSGVGAVNGAALSAVEYGDAVTHKTVITVTGLSVTMTDAGAAGCHGSHKVYDFPAGVIQLLGAVCDLSVTAGAGGIANGAAVVASLGSVTAGTNNATLTSTEADMVDSTAATLTAGVGAFDGHGSLVATGFDGHTTPVDVFLNLAVPDADSSASDTITVSGTITLTWINTGDY